jgi:hypothetical protein
LITSLKVVRARKSGQRIVQKEKPAEMRVFYGGSLVTAVMLAMRLPLMPLMLRVEF